MSALTLTHYLVSKDCSVNGCDLVFGS